MKTARRKSVFLFLTIVSLIVFPACQTNSPNISSENVPNGMVFIKGGSFEMGASDGMPFEAPVHTVELDSFLIDEHEVTVSEFAKFVRETNYQTEAEKFGWSIVFDFDSGEWKRVDGA